MTRRILALSLPVLAIFVVAARKPTDSKHENHYKAVNVPVAEGLGLAASSAESQKEFLKLDSKLTNTTGDRVFVVPKDKSEFVLPTGPMTVRAPKLFGGPLVIPPGESRSNVWMVDGETGFHVDSFAFNAKGILSAPNVGTVVPAPDFQMIPSRNDFAAGPFSCNVNDVNQTTDYSLAVFTCTYAGTGLGFIDGRKISARSKSGALYANLYKNSKRDVLLPGDKAKFSIRIEIPATDGDMQFVPYHLVFGDTFSEAVTTPLTVETWSFEVDPALTAAANK
ncbi:MAG: hypothetical protein Q8P18_34365 [Pseudomonadota bacterium]|nr:hypothetical protein [Pseudomonadota bacterium]